MQRKTKFYVYKIQEVSPEGDVFTCSLISNIFRNYNLDCTINYSSIILEGEFYDGLCITSYKCTEEDIDDVVKALKELFNIPTIFVEKTEKKVEKYA
jgi:hypothetical protein